MPKAILGNKDLNSRGPGERSIGYRVGHIGALVWTGQAVKGQKFLRQDGECRGVIKLCRSHGNVRRASGHEEVLRDYSTLCFLISADVLDYPHAVTFKVENLACFSSHVDAGDANEAGSRWIIDRMNVARVI